MSDLKVSVAEQNSYVMSVSSAPLYRFRTVQPVIPFTIGTTGTQSLLFDCPLSVFNFSKSYLQFDLNLVDNGAMTAARFYKVGNSALQPIRSIIVKGSNSSYDFCNISNVASYSRMLPFELSDKEFEELHESAVLTAAGTGLYSNGFGWSGLEHTREDGKVTTPAAAYAQATDYPFAWLGTYKARLHNSDIKQDATLDAPDVRRVPGSKVINRIIHQEATTNQGGQGNLTIRYRIPLWLFKNTILSMNRDIFTANEKLQLEFVMAPVTEYVLAGTAAATIAGAAITAAEAAGVTVTNAQMKFAIQENVAIAEQVANLVRSVGVHIPFHYTQQTRYVTPQSANFSYTSNLRGDMGSFVHAIYNLICPQNDSALSRSNVYNVGDAQWITFRSSLNSSFLQDVAQSTNDHFLALRNNKQLGIIDTYDSFQRNSVILDRFDNSKIESNSLTGLPIQNGKTIDYTIDLTKDNSVHQYWSMPVYVRTLHLTNLGASVTA